jgi:hypothetical protein
MEKPSKIATLPMVRMQRLAWLLDNSIRVPGFNYRIGIDPLLGLLPGIGEAAGGLLSTYIIAEAVRGGLPRSIVLRVTFNLALEMLIGTIPVIGDLFDMTWKANARNMHLIENYAAAPSKSVAASKGLLWGIVIGLLLLAAVVLIIGLLIIRALWSAITS